MHISIAFYGKQPEPRSAFVAKSLKRRKKVLALVYAAALVYDLDDKLVLAKARTQRYHGARRGRAASLCRFVLVFLFCRFLHR